MPKTVLAPSAPWPKQEIANDKTKPRVKTKRPKLRPVLAVSSDGLDFFAETHDQIASGKARGKVKSPVNNFHNYNKQRT
jgi:hypothetical protein